MASGSACSPRTPEAQLDPYLLRERKFELEPFKKNCGHKGTQKFPETNGFP